MLQSKFPKETVLITGASSGIGWELAKLFAADGASLVLVARRTDKLNELSAELKATHGTESVVVGLDLSDSGAPRELVEHLAEKGLAIDVLVNNAGFGQFGLFDDISIERHLNMLQLNNSALVELTWLLLPPMRSRDRGAILNIGSTASFQPGPNAAVYYASKAFVLSFSEALNFELRKTGVHVTCLCPGPTRTGFGPDSQMDQTPIFKYNSMDARDVAAVGYRALRKRRRTVIPGLINNFLAWSVRITQRDVLLWVMNLLQPAPRKTT